MADETEKKAPAKAGAKAAAPKAAAEKKPAASKAAAPKETAPKAAAKAAPKTAASKAAADKPAAEKKAPAAKAPAAKAADTKAADTKPAASKAASKDDTAAEKPKSTASKGSAAKAAPQKDAAPARPQILKAHHLRPAAGSKKDRTRVGRGEGSKGKTAGRGTKGSKARYQVRVGLEGGNLNSIMRAPKLRGFKNPFRVEYQVVNLERLAELYPKGGDVTIGDLVAKGAVRKNEKVKVLGDGEIAVKLNVAVDKVSSSAEQKIVAAGGSVK